MAAEWRGRLGRALPYVISVVIGLTSLGFTIVYTGQLQKQLQASCASAADIGSVPLQASPKPSKLGVSLVVDFRAQWRKLDCPGSLPVPPGLARWAAYYHLDGR